MDRSKFIFGNEISRKAYKKAVKTKAKFIDKYGDDSDAVYHLAETEAPAIGKPLGVRNIVIGRESSCKFDDKSLVIGNIRMGFGHYRISMAIAVPIKISTTVTSTRISTIIIPAPNLPLSIILEICSILPGMLSGELLSS